MFVNEILHNHNNKESIDYYTILGCDPGSTTEQIIAEYRNRALELHPDKATNNDERDRKEREQKFCQLLQAKDTLIDVNKRKQYDRWLRSGLSISYEKFSSLTNQTSIHWMNNNNQRNRAKAITNSMLNDDQLSSSNTLPAINDPIESFRFNHSSSSSSFNDDKILKMFPSSSKQTKKQTKKKRFGGKCYNCGLIGHMSKDCRRPKQNVDPSGAAANPITLVNWTGIMPSNNSSFYSDSGASYHIVNDRSLLTDVRKSNVRIDSIHGIEENVQFGTLLCQFFNGSVWLDIKLLDVAFIPNQPFNLISSGNLTNPRIHSGMKVVEEDGKLTVYRFGEPILTGEQTSEIRNLYKLNVRPVHKNITMASASSDDFAIWHERLCHCSTSVLERMVALKSIIGLPKDIRNNIAYCSTCHTGKMTDVSHKPVVSVNENIVSGMACDIGGYMKKNTNKI
ncbi:hypothetical protein HUG17_0646 [Dermatophagoides farinae]|uniref:Uncharacterized protein n=1 Tax=Dermatophagoides farinae TaxID=6954 RepID=A0A9D4P6P5_DERFA|nr:hypothetical protein HUG17_0646 [Dermatophagoides farinae]